MQTIKLTYRTHGGDVEGAFVRASRIEPLCLRLAVHRDPDAGYWVVSDTVTGMRVGCGSRRHGAVADALDRLGRFADRSGISMLEAVDYARQHWIGKFASMRVEA